MFSTYKLEAVDISAPKIVWSRPSPAHPPSLELCCLRNRDRSPSNNIIGTLIY